MTPTQVMLGTLVGQRDPLCHRGDAARDGRVRGPVGAGPGAGDRRRARCPGARTGARGGRRCRPTARTLPPTDERAVTERTRRAETLGRVGFNLFLLAGAVLVAGVVLRGVAAERVPWSNMYEFATAGSAGIFLVFMGVRSRLRLQWLDFASLVLPAGHARTRHDRALHAGLRPDPGPAVVLARHPRHRGGHRDRGLLRRLPHHRDAAGPHCARSRRARPHGCRPPPRWTPPPTG